MTTTGLLRTSAMYDLETSQFTPLASMYTAIRTLRLADGPDEVHRLLVGRAELAASEHDDGDEVAPMVSVRPS